MWNYRANDEVARTTISHRMTRKEPRANTYPFLLAILIVTGDHLPVAHPITEAVRLAVVRVAVRLRRAQCAIVALNGRSGNVARHGHSGPFELPVRPVGYDAVARRTGTVRLQKQTSVRCWERRRERRMAGGGWLGAKRVPARRCILALVAFVSGRAAASTPGRVLPGVGIAGRCG